MKNNTTAQEAIGMEIINDEKGGSKYDTEQDSRG